MKGFREFITRGNVIDLAVAVIIGAAFTAIVDGVVKGIFDPIIAALFNADDLAQATVQIGPVNLAIGVVLAAVINFLIVAAFLYFVIILPINKFNEHAYRMRHGHPKPEEEATESDSEILADIRDLLKAQAQR